MAAAPQNQFKEILRACALEYRESGAPVVRWYAEGDTARRMVSIAQKHGVAVEEDQAEALLLALKTVKLNTQIPRELYLAVARIYAYLIQKDQEKGI